MERAIRILRQLEQNWSAWVYRGVSRLAFGLALATPLMVSAGVVMATSAVQVSVAVTTMPFTIRVSNDISIPCAALTGLGH